MQEHRPILSQLGWPHLRSRTDSYMSRIGTNISRWRWPGLGLGLMGWLLATITGSRLSSAEAGGIEAQTPVLKSTLHGLVLTTNHIPIINATVTIKGVLAGRGAVYVVDAPDCNRHAMTKADGTFAFDGLVAETKFEGVVTAPGYELQGFWRVDPTVGPLEVKMLPAPANDPQQTVHGRGVHAGPNGTHSADRSCADQAGREQSILLRNGAFI